MSMFEFAADDRTRDSQDGVDVEVAADAPQNAAARIGVHRVGAGLLGWIGGGAAGVEIVGEPEHESARHARDGLGPADGDGDGAGLTDEVIEREVEEAARDAAAEEADVRDLVELGEGREVADADAAVEGARCATG